MRLRYLIPVLLGSALTIPAHAGLIINPIFDSSITSLASAAAVETTINGAIALFEATYANPITVTIDFENMSSGLGQSQVGFVYNQNYHQYYDALVATNANPAAIAGLTANGGNSANNPVTGNQNIIVTSADSRAVGLSGAPLCNVTGSAGNLSCSGVAGGPNAIDGIIGVNASITFPPQPNNGSNYSLTAVVEHEIDEVLGLGSAIPGCGGCTSAKGSIPTPEDLFRYNANGTRSSLNINCASPGTAFFSYSGVTDLTQFNNACNGADFGDWQGGATPQVQDAFGTPGAQPTLGPNEIAALSAIGYVVVATPEPTTATLFAISLGILVFAGKIRRTSGRAG